MIIDKHEKNTELIGLEFNQNILPKLEKLRKTRFIEDVTKKYNHGVSKMVPKLFIKLTLSKILHKVGVPVASLWVACRK